MLGGNEVLLRQDFEIFKKSLLPLLLPLLYFVSEPVGPLQHAGVVDQSTVAQIVWSKLRYSERAQRGQAFFPGFLKKHECLEIGL